MCVCFAYSATYIVLVVHCETVQCDVFVVFLFILVVV